MPGDETYNVNNPSGTGYAIGHGAIGQYFATPAEQTELSELVAELRTIIAEHRDDLGDPKSLEDATDAVEGQLTDEGGSLGLAKTILDGIVVGAGKVASVAEAAVRLQTAIASFL